MARSSSRCCWLWYFRIAHRTYLYEKEGFGGAFAIQINDEGYPFVNRFKVDGSDLVFLSEDSSNFLYVKVVDGERFTGTSDEVYELIM